MSTKLLKKLIFRLRNNSSSTLLSHRKSQSPLLNEEVILSDEDAQEY